MDRRKSEGRATTNLARYREQDRIRPCNIAVDVVTAAKGIRRRLRLIKNGGGISRRDAARAAFPIRPDWDTLDLLTIVADMETDAERRRIARRARTVVLHWLCSRTL